MLSEGGEAPGAFVSRGPAGEGIRGRRVVLISMKTEKGKMQGAEEISRSPAHRCKAAGSFSVWILNVDFFRMTKCREKDNSKGALPYFRGEVFARRRIGPGTIPDQTGILPASLRSEKEGLPLFRRFAAVSCGLAAAARCRGIARQRQVFFNAYH